MRLHLAPFLIGATVLALLPSAGGQVPTEGQVDLNQVPKSGKGVNWIRSPQDTPSFSIPPYRGSRYEAMIPHTLDIQERAALAVHGLTSETDPDRDYLLYFNGTFNANPPLLYHAGDGSDGCQFKLMESLPLMRLICGSGENSEVDRAWMATALRTIGPDGLVYWPTFPWAPIPAWAGPSVTGDQCVITSFNGVAIRAMTVYMLRDPKGPWRGEIERVVRALDKLAIHKGDFAYFPQGAFTPGGPRPRDAEIPVGDYASYAEWTIQGLAQFSHAAGHSDAGRLAGELSRYLRFHGLWYGPEGNFLPNYPFGAMVAGAPKEGVHPFTVLSPFYGYGADPDHPYNHFHGHTLGLLAMLDGALATGDRDQAEFVRKAFEWAIKKGNTIVGYFPEIVDSPQTETAESCELADMIGLALKLSAAGVGDYWDDADRWIRNQFAECQLQSSDWMYRFVEGDRVVTRRRVLLSQLRPDPGQYTTDHVPERLIGTFASWPAANDFFSGHENGIMNCCTGNATRALYYVWEHILSYRDGELRVNLLLNRPSRWADVLSYIPYQGEVEVQVKEPCRLKIRIPDWAQPAEAVCTVDGQERELGWEGRYAVVGAVTPRQDVHLRFPIRERVVETDIEKQHYILTMRGNDVVRIDPPGRYCPFYQRDHYRQGRVLWKKAQRFVSEEDIVW